MCMLGSRMNLEMRSTKTAHHLQEQWPRKLWTGQIPQDGDRGDERWLMCGMSPVNSDDDEGGAVESYVGTYIHDPSDEVANTENVQHREPEQMRFRTLCTSLALRSGTRAITSKSAEWFGVG